MVRVDPVDPVGPVILAVRAAPVAPIDQAAREDRVTMAGLDGRATTADPATAGQAAPEDLDGPATTADQMTAVGTGAPRPPICPGVGWTRAVSTTSRSTTTAGG